MNQNINELQTISAIELKKLLASSEEKIQLIDVRQAYEREICHIGGKHIPLAELDQHLIYLNDDQLNIIYCRSGVRSAEACFRLKEAGITRVVNLQGGILSWIASVDDSLPAY